MTTRSHITKILAATVAAAFLSSCQIAPSATQSFDWPSDGPPGGGGNIAIAGTTELTSLEPSEAGAASHAIPVMRNVFQPLLTRNTETSEIEPLLATEWRADDDRHWTFTLRDGVTWHDGTPFTAENAARSLTYIWDPELTYSSNYVDGAATFTALDDRTLKVELGQFDPLFEARMAVLPLASPTQIAERPESLATQPIGTGPYQFVSWNPGRDVRLELYPESWLAEPGMFDTVEWVFLQENQVRAQKVQTGEADIALGTSDQQCRTSAVDGATCIDVTSNGIRYLRIDQHHQTMLADPRIRQAIAYAIDRAGIATTFMTEQTEVADNPGPPAMSGYATDVGFEHDQDKASQLVEQAAGDGVDISIPLTVKYRVGMFPDVDDIAQTIVTNLNAVGLNAAVGAESETEGLDQYRQTFGGKTIEDIPQDRGWLFLARTSSELFDLSQPAGSILECDGRFSVYCNEDFETQLDAAKALTGQARTTALEQLWRTFYSEQVPMLPLIKVSDKYLLSPRVRITPRADMFLPLHEARAAQS
ncbi:ABC transporter substrate-binding protein [Rhodococcoides kyotonense]|uniref:Peptide/nickel transport system substrate-binding protein n=1 Tax=Rhodococcoides kyotonense TaxID=398843 RepID=A0A239N1Y9_9NOCA|nr:ABC transporter substrate-binding protein [Rhodococcus kyotonensis]SNT48493.1 peptide/nickel transport system substrate-binding protein [Rhodococcus kyotonensis]